jgi:hypothetical protein
MESDYLAEAKEKVDEAIARVEAGLGTEAEIEKLLCDASENACHALKRFYKDEERWDRIRQEGRKSKPRVNRAVGQPQKVDRSYLPATANALRHFGYKPPEEAERFVSEVLAKYNLKSLRGDSVNLEIRIDEARNAVSALADKTCKLADALRRGPQNRERREKWLRRFKSLLVCASMTLGNYLWSNAVDTPQFQKLSAPIRHELCIFAPLSVKYCADQGLEQSLRNAIEEQEDINAGQAKTSALDTLTTPAQAEDHGTAAQASSSSRR